MTTDLAPWNVCGDGIGVMSWQSMVGLHRHRREPTVQDALDHDSAFFWGLGTFDVMHDRPDAQRASMNTLFSDPCFLDLKP